MVAVSLLGVTLLFTWGFGYLIVRTLLRWNEALRNQRDAYREALTRARIDLAASQAQATGAVNSGVLSASTIPSNEELWAQGWP